MTYLAIAVLVIAAIIWAISAICAMMSALLQATTDWLGRKGMGLKASIPDELSSTASPLPTEDVEEDGLMYYQAFESLSYSIRAAQFQKEIDNILAPVPEPTLVADVADAVGLVGISPAPPYEPCFASIGSAP